jgi:hypothetical protein
MSILRKILTPYCQAQSFFNSLLIFLRLKLIDHNKHSVLKQILATLNWYRHLYPPQNKRPTKSVTMIGLVAPIE